MKWASENWPVILGAALIALVAFAFIGKFVAEQYAHRGL